MSYAKAVTPAKTVVYKGVTLSQHDVDEARKTIDEVQTLLDAPERRFEPGDVVRVKRGDKTISMIVVGGRLEERENAMRGGQHGPAYGTPEGRRKRGVILATDGSLVYEIDYLDAAIVKHACVFSITDAQKKMRQMANLP